MRPRRKIRSKIRYTPEENAIIYGEHESVQHLLLALGDVRVSKMTIYTLRHRAGKPRLFDRYAMWQKGPHRYGKNQSV